MLQIGYTKKKIESKRFSRGIPEGSLVLFDTVNKAFLSKNTNNLSEVWIGSSESNFIPLDWVDVKSGNLK
jgi:hypothetical protein